MAKIILLAQNLPAGSEAVKYATRIAKARGAQVQCLFLISPSTSTTEWMQARPTSAIQRLRKLRGRKTTADWVHTVEGLRERETEEAQRQRRELKEHFEKQGIEISCHEVSFHSGTLLRKLEELMPADLIVAGKLRFPAELTHRGIMTLEHLGLRLRCPAIDVEIMRHWMQRMPRGVWLGLAGYAFGAAVVYAVFYPQMGELNKFYMGGGLVPGIAIMATVAAVAWVCGKTIDYLLKLTRLDIY
jgi:nucleotide-binding universal stress UspA family protein